MLSVGDLVSIGAGAWPDRVAIVNKGNVLTYRELNSASNKIANGLIRTGIKKGDHVAVLMRNSVHWMIAFYACAKIGAICIPLHVRYRAKELSEMLKVAGAMTLIYGAPYEETAKGLITLCDSLEHIICVGGESRLSGMRSWEDFMEREPDSAPDVKLTGDEPFLFFFTSGTTGKPKGVLRAQNKVVLHGIDMAIRNNSPNIVDCMMSAAPLYHIGGLQGMLKMHVIGGTYISLNGIDPQTVYEKIEAFHVTQLQMLPPVTYERLYDDGAWREHDLSSVWEVCISAGKCTTEYVEHVFEMFPNAHLRPSWGSTETCSVTCMHLYRQEIGQDPGLIAAVGRLMPFMEVKIVDEKGTEVSPGERGEALVRSPMVLDHYICEGGADRATLDADGWFATGDIMYRDPKTELFYFVDRKKDIIKSGGENIYAIEVERIIQKHPAIRECAAVGVSDNRFGEAVAVAIVLEAGESITPEELIGFCKDRLPSFKKPRYYAIMDSLPVNPNGKVQKNILREQAETLFVPIFQT